MPPVDSESLQERLQVRGRLNAAEACSVALGVLQSLAEAHDADHIHGQLTPSKVLLSRHALTPDRVKLAEFRALAPGSTSGELGAANRALAESYYLAPEQAKNARDVDRRADLFAVGVILYEAVAGQVPFDASTADELLYKIVLEEAPPVSRAAPELDASLATIIDKARARDPAQRYQNGRDFELALRDWVRQVGLSLDAPTTPETHELTVSEPGDVSRPNLKLWLVVAVVAVAIIAFVFTR